MFPILAAFLLTSSIAGETGASFHRLDVTANCRREVSASGISEALEQCIADEQAARDKLQPQWSKPDRHDRQACLQEISIDNMPSYVADLH